MESESQPGVGGGSEKCWTVVSCEAVLQDRQL